MARLEGVKLDEDENLIDNLRTVLQQTSENKCSMLQDVGGRPTEIAFLNRMIVNKAEKYGLSHSLNQLLSKLIGSYEMHVKSVLKCKPRFSFLFTASSIIRFTLNCFLILQFLLKVLKISNNIDFFIEQFNPSSAIKPLIF